MIGPSLTLSFVAVLVCVPATAQAASQVAGDFNGDGRSDLAIGVPEENLAGAGNGGVVNVIYGSAAGLDATGNEFWSQDSTGVDDLPESGDRFGDTVAAGDFNNDGRDDLAIGVPQEDLGSLADAGAVQVLYGSASGLDASGSQLWSQDTPGIEDGAESGDTFGSSLSAGDAAGTPGDDLAIGVERESVGSATDGGAVNVLYGSVSGLGASGDQLWHQDRSGIQNSAGGNDRFGAALAWGDFDGDGDDDLAITVPGEDAGSTVFAGAAAVIYGEAGGLGSSGNQLWHQNSPGIGDVSEGGDMVGSSLATGDFDGDARDDLAIGFDGENIGSISHTGAVNVIYGSAGGLAAAGDQFWHQNAPGIEDVSEGGDTWAWATTAGDFNGDGRDDLAVGARREDVGSITNAGAVNVILGSTSGLTADDDVFVNQDTLGIEDDAENDDQFGSALSAGDLGGGGQEDLAIAVYQEDISGVQDCGGVSALYDATSPAGSANQLWHQDSPGILDRVEVGDRFGYSLPA